MTHDIDDGDDLASLFGGNGVPTTPKAETKIPDWYKAPSFTEPCRKCGGTGRWIGGWRSGQCFACKGAGKFTFKTSPEKRAQARASSTARKERVEADKFEAAQAWQAEHKAEVEWINAAASRTNPFEFAVSLRESLAKFGSLTEGQLAAVRKCLVQDAVRAEKRAAERVARVEAAPTVDVSKIEQAFATAVAKADREGARGIWIKPLRLQAGDVTLQVRPGSPGSQWEGMLFVKSGDRKLGHVKGGKFVRKFECTDAEQAAVLQVCADPLEGALAYAKAWSCCAVCGQTLTNDESIARGIGPICAEKFGW